MKIESAEALKTYAEDFDVKVTILKKEENCFVAFEGDNYTDDFKLAFNLLNNIKRSVFDWTSVCA